MSKPTIGWRRAGVASLATSALVLGACVAGAGAASAAADTIPPLTSSGTPNVTQGLDDQAAGDLTYVFENSFKRNATVTFALPTADCSTQAGTDAAITFANAPAVSLTKTSTAGTDTRVPSFTTTLESGVCPDTFTVTLTEPSTGANNTGADLQIKLTDVKYDVGPAASTGDVTVNAAFDDDNDNTTPATGDDDAANATVVNRSFMFVPRAAANPNEDGAQLGTATYSESTKGAYFESGKNTVTLTLTDGAFSADVTPKISVPGGYKVYHVDGTTAGAPKTTAGKTYTFVVEAPADLVKAEVVVSGLEYDAPADATADVLTSLVTQADGGTLTDDSEVVNVVSYGRTERAGGHDRYDTSVEAFKEGDYFAGLADTDSRAVVLSGGEKFPDALSANYLAGDLGTGTLLTKRNSIPDAVWNTIIDQRVDTVYITGGDLAVSKAVEEKLESTHVGDNVNSDDFINVIRLAGHDRYDTNARINEYVGQGNGDVALLAAGVAPYDSLAAGPIAYGEQYPLVLTDGKNVSDGELEALDNTGAKNVVVLGGETVTAKAAVEDIEAAGFNAVRIAGPTRYDTAAAIATWATEGLDANGDGKNDNDGVANAALGFNSTVTNVTNGLGFADALSAGPLAGSAANGGAAILLSKNATEVGDALADYLAGKTVGEVADGTDVATVFALGSTGATSASMIEDAVKAIDTK